MKPNPNPSKVREREGGGRGIKERGGLREIVTLKEWEKERERKRDTYR